MNEAANRGGLTSSELASHPWLAPLPATSENAAHGDVLVSCEPPFEDGYVFPLYEVFEVFHVEPLIPISGGELAIRALDQAGARHSQSR
jgi:hypothetical protein